LNQGNQGKGKLAKVKGKAKAGELKRCFCLSPFSVSLSPQLMLYEEVSDLQ
jgi:hypothetical protein